MELHPENVGFDWRATRGAGAGLTEAQIRDYDELGYFALVDAFTRAEIDEVVEALDPLEAKATAFLNTREGGRYGISQADGIVFNPHAVARDARLRAFATHPVFIGIVRDLIGPDVRLYWDQLVYKKQGAHEEFPWHQDNGYTFVLPQQYVTCWVALTDATIANGCPWVLPGIHRRGTLAHRWTDTGFACAVDPAAAVPVELAAGSMVVFSSLTPHRTGPNTTTGVRKSYILQYAPEGAVMYPRDGEPTPAANTDWQFTVVRDGEPVA